MGDRMRWMVLGLAACAGTTPETTKPEETPTPTTIDSGNSSTPSTQLDAYDLELWCFDAPDGCGPTATSGTCPSVTVDERMAALPSAWHGWCYDESFGALDFVDDQAGSRWFFDEYGALFAYQNWNGAGCAGFYGVRPECLDECVVDPAITTGTAYGDEPCYP